MVVREREIATQSLALALSTSGRGRILAILQAPRRAVHEVFRKCEASLPGRLLDWAAIDGDRAGTASASANGRERLFRLRRLPWRLRQTTVGWLVQRELLSRLTARQILGWVATHPPAMLWAHLDNPCVDVAYHVLRRLRLPVHVTVHDAPEAIARTLAGMPHAYVPFFLRRCREVLAAARSMDAISNDLLDHIQALMEGSPSPAATVLPSALPEAFVRALPPPAALPDGERELRIGLCGGPKFSPTDWQRFLSLLEATCRPVRFVLFHPVPYFPAVQLPANVSVHLMPRLETEEAVVTELLRRGVHACYLGLWRDPSADLFCRTSLSSKLTTYSAVGVPVLVDAPATACSARMVAQYECGVILSGESDRDAQALRALFADTGVWQRAAGNARRMCLSEFSSERWMPAFRRFFEEATAS